MTYDIGGDRLPRPADRSRWRPCTCRSATTCTGSTAPTKHSRVERVIYRLIGADPKSEQTWGAYARSVLAFSAVSILFLFVFQLVQGKLPLHLNDPGDRR